MAGINKRSNHIDAYVGSSNTTPETIYADNSLAQVASLIREARAVVDGLVNQVFTIGGHLVGNVSTEGSSGEVTAMPKLSGVEALVADLHYLRAKQDELSDKLKDIAAITRF